MRSGWQRFYVVIARIPRGRVCTYGGVAALAGAPRAARHVGFALAALRGAETRLPWQRVLGARPRGHAAVALRDPVGAALQRAMLEREGVTFDAAGRVALARFGWAGAVRPRPPSPPGGRGTRRTARRARRA